MPRIPKVVGRKGPTRRSDKFDFKEVSAKLRPYGGKLYGANDPAKKGTRRFQSKIRLQEALDEFERAEKERLDGAS